MCCVKVSCSNFALFIIDMEVLDAMEVGPIQLLDFDTNMNNTVMLTKGSIEHLFLNEVVANRDVVVVSIAGAFRKGKSFLLNFMLRYLYANVSEIFFFSTTPESFRTKINFSTNQWRILTKFTMKPKL